MLADTNLDGEIQVSLNNVPITERIPVEGEVRFKTTFEIPRLGENTLRVDFIPDHSQEMSSTFKDCCDDIVSTRIIQDSFLISRSPTLPHLEFLSP